MCSEPQDLATRNVLVNKALVCKISDFGLSRNLEDETFAIVTLTMV
jgi:hypothetical protein